MPLPYWSIEECETKPNIRWPFKKVWTVICPRCRARVLVPRSWKRINKFGTCGCMFCGGTNRIPGTKYRTQIGRPIR